MRISKSSREEMSNQILSINSTRKCMKIRWKNLCADIEA